MIKKCLKRLYSKKTLIIIIVALTAALVVTGSSLVKAILELQPDAVSPLVISAVETIAIVATLIVAIWQLSQSTNISRATFISELNKAYVRNEDYVRVYDALQACLDAEKDETKSCDCEKDSCKDRTNTEKPCKLDFKKSLISNYLTFFETIYIMHNSGVITFREMDDLFAYRFFLAVHSKYVQEMKLLNPPENFRNIFRLEHEWLEWRKDNGKGDDYEKDESGEYKEDENGKQILKKTVYNTLTLKEQVEQRWDKDRYEKLLKD